jgi:hypothetical protein
VSKRGLHPPAGGARLTSAAGRSHRASASEGSLGKARSVLASRLRERLPEIQAAVTSRVYSISDPHEVSDPAYVLGLKGALATAVEYRLAVLEAGERQAPSVPPVLLARRGWRRETASCSTPSSGATSPATRSSATSWSKRRSGRRFRTRPFVACSQSRRRSATTCSLRSAPSTLGRRRTGRPPPLSGGARPSKACSPASSPITRNSATTLTTTTSR